MDHDVSLEETGIASVIIAVIFGVWKRLRKSSRVDADDHYRKLKRSFDELEETVTREITELRSQHDKLRAEVVQGKLEDEQHRRNVEHAINGIEDALANFRRAINRELSSLQLGAQPNQAPRA